MKFVVLSDLHLGLSGVAINGLDPAARLSAAVACINRDHADADFVAIAGDLADRGEREAYEQLHRLLSSVSVPVHITLGNHDDPDAYLSVFGQDQMDPQGRVSRAIDLNGYRVILLDTTTPGTHAGALCEARRDWLAARLDEAADRPAIVIMHRHANRLSLPVDDIPLADGAGFARLVKRHPDVRMILSGHVHLTTCGVWHGLPVATLAGSHYSVNAHLPGMAGEQLRLEGPAQMAVVLADAEGVAVHFHDYLPRHLELASGLFS